MRSASLKLFLAYIFIGFYSLVSAQNIPPKPDILYPVYDKVGLLTQQEKDALNNKLIKFADSSSTEIEVIILPNTGGEDVNYLAARYGEKWGIGQKGVNNGVVFLIATEDRTMSIQQGRAIEQYITASTAKQILDYLVTPSFKQGQWYNGIDRATSAIMEAVQGKFKPQKKAPEQKRSNSSTFLILIFIIIIVIIVMNQGGKGGGGRYDDDDVTLSRRGRSIFPGGIFFPGGFGGGGGSFGGGSSGGGGFGGFGGGGSFGGGGASGGW
ncbi:methanol dehydrogenase [Elizabethkingia anophelis]|nr:methanol dehydrogenase [Elizabethkingia anophelis]MDV2466133.1 methanol dehydrogenase [Elizabethkingia anophelis]MDV3526564.1 methanol dehydrogenase [Elizabethkingia anophelis]MDV3821889.1 methanol dehydrogenase [Elizabethkingia anophelis]MDV3851066.1 methanol dehydrogenase [Elizabethkingia anophelis]